jgi:hypothetical protein
MPTESCAYCLRPARTGGLCWIHYMRKRRGKPLEAPVRGEISVMDRFMSHVDKNGPIHPKLGTRCWLWTGGITHKGYGWFGIESGKPDRAHRVAWKLWRGRIPKSTPDVLHHCDNRRCVNYETHLFVGTHTTNNKDRVAKGRNGLSANGAKTHCPQGHPYSGKNLRINILPNGKTGRSCMTCERASSEKRRRARGIKPRVFRSAARSQS